MGVGGWGGVPRSCTQCFFPLESLTSVPDLPSKWWHWWWHRGGCVTVWVHSCHQPWDLSYTSDRPHIAEDGGASKNSTHQQQIHLCLSLATTDFFFVMYADIVVAVGLVKACKLPPNLVIWMWRWRHREHEFGKSFMLVSTGSGGSVLFQHHGNVALVPAQMSQQPLDGLRSKSIKTFMVPKRWILLIWVIWPFT